MDTDLKRLVGIKNPVSDDVKTQLHAIMKSMVTKYGDDLKIIAGGAMGVDQLWAEITHESNNIM